MAAQSLPLSGPPVLDSPNSSFRGLHLVAVGGKQVARNETLDTLAQARRIVAQVELELQQRAARERAYRDNRWLTPIAAHASAPRGRSFFGRLRTFAGL